MLRRLVTQSSHESQTERVRVLLVWVWSVHAVGLSTQWASYLSFDTQRLGPNSTLANLLARRGPFRGRNATLSGIAVSRLATTLWA